MNINWKARLRNKSFWIALISSVTLLAQHLNMQSFFPDNMAEIANTLLLIATTLGVVVDPSTPTMFDVKEE